MSAQPNQPPSTAVHVLKSRRRWWKYLLIPVIVIALPVLVWYAVDFLPHALRLPADQSVIAMKAELYPHMIHDKTAIKEFPVPANHVALILRTLRPSGRDWLPAKWTVSGHLVLEHKNGSTFRVDLYWTHSRVGAFSVHRPDWPRNPGLLVSNYFRGGSDKAIRDAIKAAYAEYEAQVKDKQP